MDWQKRADSVIARLMGLEQLRHPQPFHEKQRVLSERYICRTATIGVRRGSLISKHSHGFKNETATVVKGTSGVQVWKGKDDIILDKCASLTTGNGNLHPELSKKLHLDNAVSVRNQCTGCTHNMKVSGELRGRSKLADVLIPVYMGDTDQASHLSLNKPPISSKPKNQKFERCPRAELVQYGGYSKREHGLSKMLALAGKKSMLTLSSDWILQQDDTRPEEYSSKEETVCLFDILEPKGGMGCAHFQTSPGVNATVPLSSDVPKYIQGIQDVVDDDGSENEMVREIKLNRRNAKVSISNVTPSLNREALDAVEGGHSSYSDEDFGREVLQSEYSEDESAYSNSSRNCTTTDFQEDQKRACQHSPDSVLKPYNGQSLSPFQCFDSIGPQSHIQVLNLESEDTCSEGSVMGVSGDNDSEQFSDLSEDSIKIKRWIGDEECRNFSYLVEVLDEAGFCGVDTCMDLKTFYSLECPIDPLVFEMLEKKYRKQTSWQMSERRLLFDGINTGLMYIFNPATNFHNSIQSTICLNLKRDKVEDELWRMLISEEEGKAEDLSEKAIEKWFEAEEGMNLICQELESNLFDELVTELATLWN